MLLALWLTITNIEFLDLDSSISSIVIEADGEKCIVPIKKAEIKGLDLDRFVEKHCNFDKESSDVNK